MTSADEDRAGDLVEGGGSDPEIGDEPEPGAGVPEQVVPTGRSATSELPPELPRPPEAAVDAPETPVSGVRVAVDTRKKKKNYLRELELSEGAIRWDAPEGSRTRRGGSDDIAGMALDVAMMVECGPATCQAALSSGEATEWDKAIKSEEDSIVRNGTFVEVGELPPGKKAIPTKVVLTKKLDPAGKPVRYKVRLVAQGFRQVPGVDYFETFAPVAALDSVRLVLTIAAAADLVIEQLDVVTAFLGGKVNEEIYVRLLDGILDGPRVVRLIKALDGLKQSPRCWNVTINIVIVEELGFARSRFDPCVYMRADGTFILIYVDDLLIIGHSGAVEEIKRRLGERFEVVLLGEVRHFLGMVVTRNRVDHTITLSQAGYVERLLGRFNLAGCYGVSSPLDSKVKVTPFVTDQDTEFDSTEYRQAIGSLRWLADAIRPDIMYATGLLGRYAAKPGKRHWLAVQRVLRYLSKTKGLGLCLGGAMRSQDLISSMVGYVDADFAGDVSDYRSTSGYVIKIGMGVVLWRSRKQSITATSTADAEFIASAAAIGELLWFRELVADILRMEAHDLPPTVLYNDNVAALSTFANGDFKPHLRHIGVKFCRAREVVAGREEVDMRYCGTKDMVADGLTKSLPIGKHMRFVHMCGLG